MSDNPFPVFYLSNLQAKNLLVRQQPLRLAIPEPPGGTSEPMEYARRVLPDNVSNIKGAKSADVYVIPSTGGGGDGFGAAIGTICDQDQPPRVALTIRAIVVDLQPINGVRHQPQRLQWPGKCICGEMQWPKRNADVYPDTLNPGVPMHLESCNNASWRIPITEIDHRVPDQSFIAPSQVVRDARHVQVRV